VATSSKDVTLQWTDSTQGENYIKVLRSTNGTSFGVVAWAPADSTSYVDTGRTANTTYWYRLQAYENGGGVSPYSNTASATTLQAGAPPPPASGLTAVASSTSSIALAWADNSTTESGFRIERAREGIAFAVAATVSANVTAYANSGLLENTTYSYRVVAFNSDGSASPSNVATATTASSLTAPGSLTATVQSSYKVLLNWVDTTTTESGFKVYRAPSGGSFSLLGSVGSNVTTYTNGSAQPATTYQYRVVAVTASGATSPPSNVVTVTTPAVPATPQNLTATAVSSTRVDLAWQDVSTDETHFKVERSTNGTSFSTVSWPTANATVFVDNNRQSKTTYYYRVSSYNANGTSAPSNVAVVTTP
jgi:fibronectin type 3 domain-containing protein